MTTSLARQYHNVRSQTLALTEGLSPEDMTAQSMPDASPVKWHLAHTSWFFETFILARHQAGYRLFNDAFPHLFNSYYESAGSRYIRPQRGLLTRPSIDEVIAYRTHVDEHMAALLASGRESIADLATIGLHHEMQHQELILTDLLHLLSFNPLFPAVQNPRFPETNPESTEAALQMLGFDGGLVEIGSDTTGFCYDNEQPRHRYYLQPFQLANRLVTNREWMEFIEDGGYENPLLWLSDGWSCRQKNNWTAPLYWQQKDGTWFQFGLDGLRKIIPRAPVCHISYYEADAFARWAGKRLPTEQEWETAASEKSIDGNFAEQHIWRPLPSPQQNSIQQLYGDVWEWTGSPYTPYPGFVPAQGALGEYNGKFMANQFVLRGGSCATPVAQIRASYRNFFYPHQRWQFSGVRLAGQ